MTIIKAEFWKVGQLRPGDTIRFVRTTFGEALATELRQDNAIAALDDEPAFIAPNIFRKKLRTGGRTERCCTVCRRRRVVPGVVYRQAGDKYLLVEYGPLVLDFELRFRVHTLMEWFNAHPVKGVIELSPGVRSLQINFDGRVIPLRKLLEILVRAEGELPSVESLEVPTRILRMPLAYDESGIRLTIQKYQQSVRAKAPWLPSNIEFIRRMNGLGSVDEVRETVYSANYLVLGLGDVYLGAPCAVPMDPRHRLVTTKYNPARTFTVENVVGIGGVYMCIYGMEGPGGYQLVGRTAQVWNTHKCTREFEPGKPWLLRFFDQIRFFPVSEKELLDFRRAFLQGKAQLDITEEVFSFAKLPEIPARHMQQASRLSGTGSKKPLPRNANDGQPMVPPTSPPRSRRWSLCRTNWSSRQTAGWSRRRSPAMSGQCSSRKGTGWPPAKRSWWSRP